MATPAGGARERGALAAFAAAMANSQGLKSPLDYSVFSPPRRLCCSPAPSAARLEIARERGCVVGAGGAARADQERGGNRWAAARRPGPHLGRLFLFIAEGLRAVGPCGVAFVRIAIGFATLALFPAARRRLGRRGVSPGDRLRVAAVGSWVRVPAHPLALAERHVSSAVTGMLNGANPLFTAIVASLLARRVPSRGVAVGLAVGLGGSVLVGLPAVGEGASSAGGVAMIVAALAAYGVVLNLVRPLQQRYGAMPVLWRAQAVAMALTAPLGVRDVLAARWSPEAWGALAALGALGTGAAFVLMSVAAGRLRATGPRPRLSSFGVALALGVLVRGERVAPMPCWAPSSALPEPGSSVAPNIENRKERILKPRIAYAAPHPGLRGDGRSRPLPRPGEPRGAAAAPRAAARLAAQRLRLLHRHALEGPASARRDGAAALLTRRLAENTCYSARERAFN
jgi:drug/metabolite transporter (DMT)-like permease